MSTALGRRLLVAGVLLAAAAVAGWWVVKNTQWVQEQVPRPPRGEAARDPMWAAQRLAGALGAQVARPTTLDRMPPPGATLVLASWHWAMFPGRDAALRAWVQQDGGHLVLPGFALRDELYRDWVAIDEVRPKPKPNPQPKPGDDPAEAKDDAELSTGTPVPRPPPQPASAPGRTFGSTAPAPARCRLLHEPLDRPPAFGARRDFISCGWSGLPYRPRGEAQWSLGGPTGADVLRVGAGRGSVTVVSSWGMFSTAQLLQDDHPLIFAATLRPHAGQVLWIVTDESRPPILAWLWQQAWVALLLLAAAIAAALWRAGARFGPRVPVAAPARRSIAEQVRGTAAFVGRHDAAAWHQAARRALDEAAARRLPGWLAADAPTRVAMLAAATGLDGTALAAALQPPATADRNRHARTQAIVLLETARRALAAGGTRGAAHQTFSALPRGR